MKKEYFDYMFEIMRTHSRVYMIFVGLGWPRLESFKKEFGDRVINTEAAEQTAMDIAVGLAYAGKIPFVYTITPFLLRGFETIRTYIDHEKLHVCLLGAGVNNQYSKHDGFSHEAGDIPKILRTLPHIDHYFPETVEGMKEMIDDILNKNRPAFLNIRK